MSARRKVKDLTAGMTGGKKNESNECSNAVKKDKKKEKEMQLSKEEMEVVQTRIDPIIRSIKDDIITLIQELDNACHSDHLVDAKYVDVITELSDKLVELKEQLAIAVNMKNRMEQI